jgi:hypothetical protein
MRKTLLQGGHYVPSHSTDIRETFKRLAQNQEKEKPLVVKKILETTESHFKTLADFDHLLGQRESAPFSE